MLAIALSLVMAFHLSPVESPPPQGIAGPNCPADDQLGRELPTRFLTRAAYAEDRANLGLAEVTPGSIRVLTDATDPAACQWFAVNLLPMDRPNWRWTAYQVGNYYFIAWRYHSPPDGSQRLGLSPAYIFDKSFQPVLGITM